MSRVVILIYGGLCYLLFLAVFLYAIGFVGNLVVPKSLDSGPQGHESESVLIDVLLLALFAVPHSIMARRGFKALPAGVRWVQFSATRQLTLPVRHFLYGNCVSPMR